MRKIIFFSSTLSLIFLGAVECWSFDDVFWQNGHIDTRVDNPTNWNTGQVPGPNDSAHFPTIAPPWTMPTFVGNNTGNMPTNVFRPAAMIFNSLDAYTFQISGPSTLFHMGDPTFANFIAVIQNTGNEVSIDVVPGAQMVLSLTDASDVRYHPITYNVVNAKLTAQDSSDLGIASIVVADGNLHISSSTAGQSHILLTGNSHFLGDIISSFTVIDNQLNMDNATIIARDQTTIVIKDSFSLDTSQSDLYQQVQLTLQDISDMVSAKVTLHDQAKLVVKDEAQPNQAIIDCQDQGTSVVFNPANSFNGDTTLMLFRGTLSGQGTFIKEGSIQANFWGDGTNFTGPTFINDGTLALYNTLGGDVTVNGPGILSGDGHILKDLTLTKGATIISGIPNIQSTIGTTVVDGNYSQAADSLYQVLVNNQGSGSLIDVGGTATLAPGAAVAVAPTNTGEKQLPPNAEFEIPILHAAQGVTGTYTLLTVNPLIAYSLSYDQNNVFLKYTNALHVLAETFNQESVSTQLQSLQRPTPKQSALLNTLVALPPQQARKALDQMSGEQYTNVTVQAIHASQQFIQHLYDPLRTMIASECVCDSSRQGGSSVWLDSSYHHTRIHNSNHVAGSTTDGYDLTLMGQGRCQEVVVGVAAAYHADHTTYHLSGKSHGFMALGGLYGAYRADCFYVLGDLALSYGQQKLKRHVNVGDLRYSLRGTPKMYQGDLYVESGFNAYRRMISVQPFMGIEGSYYFCHHIHEHSVTGGSLLNLDIAAKHHLNAWGRLGVHLTTNQLGWLDVAVDLAWRYRFTSLGNNLKAHFENFGHNFVVHGVHVNRNSLEGVVDVSSAMGCGWSWYANAAGSWSPEITSYTLLAGVSLLW